MSAVHFISDLHLPKEPSPLREGFLRYLAGAARNASQLYILGDLFEYWIGDDAGLRDYHEEARALTALVRYGVPTSFMHGNRDFLVGERFAHATGVQLLPDSVIETFGGVPTLLAHGDQYCTDDIRYQKWRRFARNRMAQAIFRRLPEARRQKIAGDVRGRSGKDKLKKNDMIMDVNADAIAKAFAENSVPRMIHGHTHRPADHVLGVDGNRRERIVLADWTPERMEYLEVSDAGFRRRPI